MPAAAGTTGARPVTLTMNGQEVQAQPGQTILEAARAAGIEIPTLCHDPRLEPYGACRMCLVEVEGARGPMAACGTAVREGMNVQTHSEKIIKLRKFVLELLLTNHPLDCPVCEAAGDCKLQDYAYEYLVDMVPWGWRPPEAADPGEHPNIAHYGSRCILCGRCVRICREVMSIGCWGYLNRGYESEVDTPYRLPLQEVGCVSCGQCVSTCPVGAITGQRTSQGAREWQTAKTETVCSYCSNGCTLVLHSYKGKVVKVASGEELGLNRGNLCVKGRFGLGYADSEERLTKPLLRDENGGLREATWEEALGRIAERLSSIKAESGGGAVAALCGTHATNEAAYLLQKLMRTVVGSNNVDCVDHCEQAAAEEALAAALGSAAATNSRQDLGEADVILVVGSNLTESNPVLALDVIKALRSGKTVVVVDPRSTEIARRAKYHLAIKPGSDLALLRGLLRTIVDLGMTDTEFVGARTAGYADLEASLSDVDVSKEAAVCGIDVDTLRSVAQAYAQAGAAAIMFGGGLTRGPDGATAVRALADLALLTGNVGRPGTGVYPLRSGANSQGALDMGVRPAILPGGGRVDDPECSARLEAAWGAPIPGEAGFASSADLIEAIESGTVRCLYALGADPALAFADERRVKKALEKVDFLIVQDCFVSATAELAEVVLPAAVPSEIEGTFTNGERFIQLVRAAAAPQGASQADWKIVQGLAETFGADWAYATPADVMREISDVVPTYGGVSYARLENELLQWPCRDVADPCESILFTDESVDGKGVFGRVDGAASESGEDSLYPFILLTGSVLEHHETGVRTCRAAGLTGLMPRARVEISPQDAEGLGIGDGDKLTVTSAAGGSVSLDASVTARVPKGTVFVPGFSAEAPVTRLVLQRSAGAPHVKVERAV